MYYAYKNGELIAGAINEEQLILLCRKLNITNYTISQETPKKQETFEKQKNKMLTKVNEITASKITGGFVSLASGEPVTYDSDKDTQLTMQGIALNVQNPLFASEYPNGCPVRGYPIGSNEKQVYMLNADQVMRWCADLSMHIGTCKQRGWELQAQVNACTTKEELEAVVL